MDAPLHSQKKGASCCDPLGSIEKWIFLWVALRTIGFNEGMVLVLPSSCTSNLGQVQKFENVKIAIGSHK